MGTVNEFAGFLSGDGLNPNGMNNKDAQENNEQRVDFLAAQKEQRDVSWQLGGKRKSKGEKCEEQNSGGCGIRKRFDQAASRRLERGLLRGLHSAIELISPPGR
jgi:hypothetical protein